MHTTTPLSLGQIRALIEASDAVGFQGQNQEEIYAFIAHTLRQQRDHELRRDERGWLRRYLAKMTGLSRTQIARLITLHQTGKPVQPKPYRRHRFPQRSTRHDIELLAAVDAAHGLLSGPATQKLL